MWDFISPWLLAIMVCTPEWFDCRNPYGGGAYL